MGRDECGRYESSRTDVGARSECLSVVCTVAVGQVRSVKIRTIEAQSLAGGP